MENDPPLSHSLPTLTQLTQQRSSGSLAKRKSALMNTARVNSSRGLLTPPSSQQTTDMDVDATKTLISPPPEETLWPSSRRVSSSAKPASMPFTPSLLASSHRQPATTTKRKRQAASISTHTTTSTEDPVVDINPVVEATPNPKPRKQLKHHPRSQSLESPSRARVSASPSHPTTPTKRRSLSPTKRTLLQSPHAANPDADFIPPVPAHDRRFLSVRAGATSSARRSLTPYEPPPERFTPPREVVRSPLGAPSVSKSSKRKTAGVKRDAVLAVETKVKKAVKKERPEVDLSKPLPPPSPTEDPLLLSGPPIRRVRAKPKARPSAVELARTSFGGKSRVTPDIGSTSPGPVAVDTDTEAEAEATFHAGGDALFNPEPASTDFTMSLSSPPSGVDALPLFDLNALPDSGGGWSDSESEGEGEGEYTGKWKMVTVPTKVDPPTSGTRERMVSWGRPVSPFPGGRRKGWGVEGEDADEEDGENEIEQEEVGAEGRTGEEEVTVDEMEVVEDVPVELASEAVAPLVDNPRLSSPVGNDGTGASPTRLEEQDSFDDDVSREEESLDQSEEQEQEEDGRETDDEDYDMRHVSPEAEEQDRTPSPHHDSVAPLDEDASMNGSVSPEVERADLTPEDVASPLEVSPAREVSVEQEEEEEEESVDRELSREPVSDDDGEEGGADEHLGVEEKVLPPARRADSPGYLALFGTRSEAAHSPRFERTEPVEREMVRVGEAAEEGSSESESEEEDGDVIKITSSDPRAAARAAAILKLHDYDCLPKILLKQRRHSHSALDSISRSARRKDASAAGIAKSMSPVRQAQKRRATMGGMLGDKVIIPGSPAMTLPELLRDVEVGLGRGERTPVKERDPFKTPVVRRVESGNRVGGEESGAWDGRPRDWTKEDWKQLDACFTDERLDVGAQRGLGDDALAPVDEVQVDDVVDRFIQLTGGADVVDGLGLAWNRDNLVARTRALQKKQRSGNVAPPTPKPRSGSATPSIGSAEVPEFTPLPRRLPPKPKLPPPLADSPFETIPSQGRKLPPSLLAPRYSHLLEEAVAVSQETPVQDTTAVPLEPSSESVRPVSPPLADQGPAPPSTIGKRVKGFLFSYLPTLSKSAPPRKTQLPRPGLPLPPPELLEKPRGPISTPVRPPLSKPTHPRDLVHLNPAPPPQPSMIPRVSKPRRLVDLHPLPPAPVPTRAIDIPRGRRSSGGSVKDLVQSFEDLDSRRISEQGTVGKGGLKRVKSNGDWKGRSESKPVWRP